MTDLGKMSRRDATTFVISITPFDDEERLDEEALRGHFRRLADSGIGVYVGGGGSGEGFTLNPDEARRVLQIASEELKGKVPVRAMGVEPRTARQMIDFSGAVAEAGLEAMQIYSLDMGHGNVPRPNELERYLVDILSVVRIPVILSTHMSVGYQLPIDLISGLISRYDNIIGVNCTNPDLTYLLRLVDRLDDHIEVHVGGPMQALTALAFGASGYLSSEGNLAPRLCVSVVDRYRSGDVSGSHHAYTKVMRIFTMAVQHGGIRFTKAALTLLGLPGGIPRRPQLPVTDPSALGDINAALDELGIRDIEELADTGHPREGRAS
jgi:4-hydroxy-tetrahydrodipicolinate synthase